MGGSSSSLSMKYMCPALILFVSVAGCREATAPEALWLLVQPTQAQYQPGDTVTLTLRNVGPQPIVTNVCGSELQRLDGGKWTGLGIPEGNCGDIGFGVGAGQSRDLSAGALPGELAAGTYRYVVPDAFIDGGSGGHVPMSNLRSAPFLVEP
jgi:hypothetical protein